MGYATGAGDSAGWSPDPTGRPRSALSRVPRISPWAILDASLWEARWLGGDPQSVDCRPEAVGQLNILADVHAFGFDGLADAHGKFARIEMFGVNGQQIVDTRERDGDDGNLRANGEICGA